MAGTGNSIANSSESAGPPSAKPKQTRRRQRLNCVECTRRRQKCDRQTPCGLCVSRGIPQLCRWEPLVARPAPKQGRDPNTTQPLLASQQSTISTLTARVAALEKMILQSQRGTAPLSDSAASSQEPGSLDHSSRSTTSSAEDRPSPHASTSSRASEAYGGEPSSSSPSDTAELAPVDFDLQVAAVKMAQMSLAPYNEYVGAGTVLCAIHKLGYPDVYRYPYARSTNPTFINPRPGLCKLRILIRQLLSNLPSRDTLVILVDGYFAERNWEFGIPESWFRKALSQMWAHLDARCPGPSCTNAEGCARCLHEINPHWISLVFAVLALAPRRLVGSDARKYFSNGMEARRIVENHMFITPAYSSVPTEGMVHGAALSCIATALFAASLTDRGRVSDAWKITGTALRNAQAVGLHRDPGWRKWEKMDREECELRLLGWWVLIISDRVHSLILGRPTMANSGASDVKLVPGMLHGDGSMNPYVHYQQAFIGLMALAEELMDKCLGVRMASYATILEMDRKLQHWLSQLHPSLDWRHPHNLTGSATQFQRSVAYQRHMCAAFYLSMSLNLHRIYHLEAPPILPLPNPLAPRPKPLMNPSRERCIEVAMELVTAMCDAHDEAAQWATDPPLPLALFHYVYFLFDGAVSLVSAVSQEPPHAKARECLALIDRALRMLQACADANKNTSDGEGEGDTALRGITILTALRKAGRWDERFADKSATPPSATDSQMPQSVSQDAFTVPLDAPPSYAELAELSASFTPPSFPFLNPPRAESSAFTMPGPVHLEAASSLPINSGDRPYAFAPEASLAVPMMDFGGGGGNTSKPSAQTMVMPYDMLLNSNSYDIDWESVMGGWTDGEI